MEDEEQRLIDSITEDERKNAEAIKQMESYKKMTYAQVLQCPENKMRLFKVEMEQKDTFGKILRKRPELKHLIADEKDLFATYFMGFLNGEFDSINDFFYENNKLTGDNKTDMKNVLTNEHYGIKKKLKAKWA